jgi:hypothetical protein
MPTASNGETVGTIVRSFPTFPEEFKCIRYVSTQTPRPFPCRVDFKRYTLALDIEDLKRNAVRTTGTMSYLNRSIKHAEDDSILDFLNDSALAALVKNSDAQQAAGHVFSTNILGRYSEPDQHHGNIP